MNTYIYQSNTIAQVLEIEHTSLHVVRVYVMTPLFSLFRQPSSQAC